MKPFIAGSGENGPERGADQVEVETMEAFRGAGDMAAGEVWRADGEDRTVRAAMAGDAGLVEDARSDETG